MSAGPCPSTLCQAFGLTAERHADQIALRTLADGDTITWTEYSQRVRDVAAGFHEIGLRKGQTVAFMLASRPEFNIADTAALQAGVTPFSIYNTSALEQISHLLRDADARLIVAEPPFVDVLERERQITQFRQLATGAVQELLRRIQAFGRRAVLPIRR